jgi:putative oxidoreductase
VLVVFAEFVCSIFIILGLGTRLAVIPLIINMTTAAVFAHAHDPFAVKEKALLFLIIFFLLLFFGPGRYSLDHTLAKRLR